MASTSTGRFVWYELMTTDPKAAIAFYTEVIGWKTVPFEGTDYMMWAAEQGPVGGVAVLSDAAKKAGTPPHWMSYVTVGDVDATVTRIKKLGGRAVVEATDMPDVGRFAIAADPQGATLAVFKPTMDMAPHDTSKDGEFSWNELLTTDRDAALKFYSDIFGWEKLAEHDMGPMGVYLIYGKDGKQLGGMFNKPKDVPAPPSWLYYVHVSGLDAMLGRAKSKGAKVLNGPMDVPGGDRIAQLSDPQGAMFCLHETKKA